MPPAPIKRKRPSIKKEAAGGILRGLLTASGGGAVVAGAVMSDEKLAAALRDWISEADLAKGLGALAVLGGIAWSVLAKYLKARAATR